MKNILSALLFSFILAGCGVDTELRKQTANHIARPAFMVERMIPANEFQIQAWERMHNRNEVATVYIEDDAFLDHWGEEDIAPDELLNPTPINPVALHLASRDQSKNLGYLARPCQYIKMANSKGCKAAYARERRHAPEVMAAYEAALDNMAATYDLTGFHLVGHGGGANVAAVLAAKRKDVLSLRTVAGDLNPDFTAGIRGFTPLDTDSVLAVDYGSSLSMVPQHHFIGAADKIISPGAYHSYRQMVGLSECIHYSLIADAEHQTGWVEKWPELLMLKPQCAVVHTDLPTLPPAGDFPNSDYRKGYKK